MDMEPMRSRRQSADVSPDGHGALRTGLGHDEVPADRGVRTAALDTHRGDCRAKLAALLEALIRGVHRTPVSGE